MHATNICSGGNQANGIPPICSLNKCFFLECSRPHYRHFTDSNATYLLSRTFYSQGRDVLGLQVCLEARSPPKVPPPSRSWESLLLLRPTSRQTHFLHPRCLRDAGNMLLVLQSSWTDKKKKTPPRMDKNAISCLAELKIALHWLVEGALGATDRLQYTKGVENCWLWWRLS